MRNDLIDTKVFLLFPNLLFIEVLFLFFFQSCDLAQQSIVHIVQNPRKKDKKRGETENENVCGIPRSLGREDESLTRVDLNTNLLPSNSAGLAVVLDTVNNSTSPLSDNSGNSLHLYIPKYSCCCFPLG